MHPILLTYYMFWSDVDQFKRTPIPDVRTLKFLARNIHSNYLAPNAPYATSLSPLHPSSPLVHVGGGQLEVTK